MGAIYHLISSQLLFVFFNTANTHIACKGNRSSNSNRRQARERFGGWRRKKYLNPCHALLGLFSAGRCAFAHFSVSMNSFNILAKFLKVHINMFDVSGCGRAAGVAPPSPEKGAKRAREEQR